jgi:hypothetical protein
MASGLRRGEMREANSLEGCERRYRETRAIVSRRA